jgi:hypothetical protein
MPTVTSTADSPTVFVVGAGASYEVELPLGSDLTSRIAQCLDFYSEGGRLRSGDELILEALKLAAKSGKYKAAPFTEYTGAGRRIAAAMPQALSIDNYLDVHNHSELVNLCGKLAIVRTILKAEAASTLRLRQTNTGPTLSFRDTGKTYFSRMFQLITENCRFDDLPNRLRRLCFVVFNYDRCIEHYLHYAVRNYYAVPPHDATSALSALRIFHPYGTVGSLPTDPVGEAVDLGGEVSPHQLLNIAGRVRTFTEGTDPNASDILAIRSAISSCRRLVFLGFAYHRLNLKLLSPDDPAPPANEHRKVFGTAFGVSQSDRELISIDLSRRFGVLDKSVILDSNVKCADLFGEYWRSLSLA